MVLSNLIYQCGPVHRLSASQIRGLGTRLACLLTCSGPGTSGGPTAHRVRGVSAWCLRSVHIVRDVADQNKSRGWCTAATNSIPVADCSRYRKVWLISAHRY